MILFPNIKINIGLNIIERRTDGYHNIETLFYPINYSDVLEVLPSDEFELINLGLQIDCSVEDNLCYNAWQIIDSHYNIGNVRIILYKKIPFGTGLGSGSSDAAFTIKAMNEIFDLRISEKQQMEYAAQIGADCTFFIKNKPVFATEIGTKFSEINIDLSKYKLLLCFPKLAVSTVNAYKNCKPQIPQTSLSDLLKLPVEEWKGKIKNDFEISIFEEYPVLSKIKTELYNKGAVYAQMSGSGAAIYGLFNLEQEIPKIELCETVCVNL